MESFLSRKKINSIIDKIDRVSQEVMDESMAQTAIE